MGVLSTDVKELWCDSCLDFMKTYDSDQQAEGEYDRDLAKFQRDGCPECGSKERTSYSSADDNQA